LADKIIDDDLGGIRLSLVGLGDELDRYQNLFNQKNHDQKWFEELKSARAAIDTRLNSFNKNIESKQEDWSKDIDTDIKDLNDWYTGENWMRMNAKVSDYYNAQSKILELQNFTWKNPKRSVFYGLSGIAGGSNSSWWKSIISLGAKAGGIIGGTMTTGGTSTAI